MSNSCCAAPVLFSRRPDASSIAVAPPWNYCSVPGSPRKSPRGPPAESTEADEAARVLRDVLAVAARARYSEWAGANAAGSSSLRPEAAVHPALYFPRIRQRELELASEWAGADKVKSARERVEDEVREAADRFSTRSCYPLFGPPVRNVCFSYTWGCALICVFTLPWHHTCAVRAAVGAPSAARGRKRRPPGPLLAPGPADGAPRRDTISHASILDHASIPCHSALPSMNSFRPKSAKPDLGYQLPHPRRTSPPLPRTILPPPPLRSSLRPRVQSTGEHCPLPSLPAHSRQQPADMYRRFRRSFPFLPRSPSRQLLKAEDTGARPPIPLATPGSALPQPQHTPFPSSHS